MHQPLPELVISPSVLEKLVQRHKVTREEVEQCFLNNSRTFADELRLEHASDPPTQWFIGETDRGRKLKVAFIFRDGKTALRTAYPATEAWEKEYLRVTKPL